MAGMGGLGHDFKVGANFINEPHLFLTFNTGTGGYAYTHLDNNINGPISAVTLSGGSAEANTPMKQYATFIQDDWRLSNRLTLNLGFRYDAVTGMAIDQTKNPNFVILDKAGKAGALAGIAGFEDFGKSPAEDKNNWQPRVGFAYDLKAPAGCHPRWLGPLLRLRLHQREHPVRGRQCHGHRRRHGLLGEQLERHQEPGRQLLQGERPDQQHPVAERGRRRAASSTRTSRHRASSSRSRIRCRSAGRTSSTRRPRSTSITCIPTARTSAGVPR
jgi:hypothetical protein